MGRTRRHPGPKAAGLVALLDHHELERVPVMGGSGGGPHALALAATHPDRVSAVTVIVGSSPLVPDEVGRLVGANAAGWAAAERGWEPLHELLVKMRERVLGPDGIAGVLSDAPPEDLAIMRNPAWLRTMNEANAEALRQGAEGWADESLAIHRPWDFDPGAVQATVTWWHGDDDKNVPLSAARRGAARLPRVDLRVWRGEGHLASQAHEGEILQDLLSRSE